MIILFQEILIILWTISVDYIVKYFLLISVLFMYYFQFELIPENIIYI